MAKKVKKEVPQIDQTEISAEDRTQVGWQAYLAGHQRGSQRAALQRAIIGEPTDATRRRGKVDGQGSTRFVLEPPEGVEPWSLPDDEDVEEAST